MAPLQSSDKKHEAKKANSHWGIGSEKVRQDEPGKVQMRVKENPRSSGRRPKKSHPEARLMMQSTWVVSGRMTRDPALELSLIWSVCSRWCFVKMLVVCSFHLQRGSTLLHDSNCLHFPFLGTAGDSSKIERKVFLPVKTRSIAQTQNQCVL